MSWRSGHYLSRKFLDGFSNQISANNLSNFHADCSFPYNTAQKMKFSIKDFFSKCDQIRSFLRIWSHLLKKSLMENFIFCAVQVLYYNFWTAMLLLLFPN